MSYLSIKRGDIVLFSELYLSKEPQTELHNAVGRVICVGEDEYAEVEFNHLPGTTCKISVYDLDPAPVNNDPDSLSTDPSYEELEQIDNEEIGGMSKAELIRLKLSAQETDPDLDRNITELLN